MSPAIYKKRKGDKYVWYKVILILFIFLYTLFLINPELIYYRNTYMIKAYNFQFSEKFLIRLLGFPGGPGRYITSFLVQFFYYPLIGPIIITFLTGVLYYFSNTIIKQITGSKSFIFSCIPAITPILAYYHYSNQIFGLIGISIAMAFAIFYNNIGKINKVKRSLVFSVLFLILYYLVAQACLFFTIIVIFKEVKKHKNLFFFPLVIINIIILYFLASWLFDAIILKDFKLLFTEGSIQGFIQYVYLYFIIGIPWLLFLNYYYERSKSPDHFGHLEKMATYAKNKITTNVISVLFCLILVFNLFYNFSYTNKTYLNIIKYTELKKWDKMLEEINKIPPGQQSIFLSNDCIRSLYHKGELGSKMFQFTHLSSNGIEPMLLYRGSQDYSFMNLYRTMNISMDLGEINLAEKIAFELMENIDITPNVLYNLALIQLVKKEPASAKVFLNQLNKFPHLNPDMKQLIQYYKNGNNLEEYQEVRRLKSLQHNKDFIYYTSFNTKNLLNNLNTNNLKNKMAFEYLMAGCLLSLQLEEILINAANYKTFGFEKLPEHIEEALVLFMYNNQYDVPEIGGFPIRQETKDRFAKFANIHYQNRYDLKKAESILFPEFGTSYFFYYVFGYSGKEN